MDDKSLVRKAKASPGLIGRDLVKDVGCKKSFHWNRKGQYRVVVIDCGVKYNILRELEKHDCHVIVVPAQVSDQYILKLKPHGLLISNGPGDPEPIRYVVETVRKLIGKLPMFGICQGNHILCMAMGGKIYKLKFGHHGGNHPVKDIRTGKVFISVQNHGFCTDIDSLNKDEVEITHINLNDNSLEGIRYKRYPIFSVQFHPECSPGPHDTKYLFKEFIALMQKNK